MGLIKSTAAPPLALPIFAGGHRAPREVDSSPRRIGRSSFWLPRRLRASRSSRKRGRRDSRRANVKEWRRD